MRYPASEKLEIIRTVEGSHLPTKQTLDMLGIPRSTFYRWYDLYLEDGLDGLSDKSPCPKSVWNRIPDGRRDDLIEFALKHKALTTRELAVIHTRQKLNTSERRTCKVLDVARSTLNYKAVQHDDALRLAMIRLAKAYGRYGYRKITQLLHIEGWKVNLHLRISVYINQSCYQLPSCFTGGSNQPYPRKQSSSSSFGLISKQNS